MDDIWRDADLHTTESAKQRKCVYLLMALRDDGLVSHDGVWRITPAGEATLERLNAGETVVSGATPLSGKAAA